MASTDVIGGVDLTGERYTVKQSLIRNKYAVYGGDGSLVLKAKQKLFKMKEDFPFVTPDGETVFRVKAQNLLDIAGDYAIIDERSGETIAVLEKQFTFLKHVWRVKDPDHDGVVATVESRGALVELLRNIPLLEIATSFIPHKYTIESPRGDSLGEIAGQFSFRDVYEISIQETGEAPREALVASAIAIDALEGN